MVLNIGIILGSTRPGRSGDQVARWVLEHSQARTAAKYELIDLADFSIPHLDSKVAAARGDAYEFEHTRLWSDAIAKFDGYIFVTPEYNHSISGVLKDSIDHLYLEWNNKSAGIVSYGGLSGGVRAAEQLRLILAEVRIADVRSQVSLSILWDFENRTTLKPHSLQPNLLEAVFAEVELWAGALKAIRPSPAPQ